MRKIVELKSLEGLSQNVKSPDTMSTIPPTETTKHQIQIQKCTTKRKKTTKTQNK